jgi:hypothetical protein
MRVEGAHHGGCENKRIRPCLASSNGLPNQTDRPHRSPHDRCLRTHQDGIRSNGEDCQERRQQFVRKGDKDAAKQRAENGDNESANIKPIRLSSL